MHSSFIVAFTASRVASLTHMDAGTAIYRKCTIKDCTVLKAAMSEKVTGKNEMHFERYTSVAVSQILFQVLVFLISV